ncbi:hypothetical protein [Thermoactinomyces sp. DSM 45892]|nr:hypothetical protein [Thermoactinomyces sp. DSM 45892]SDY83470.1 hypothetical protein SAMN05444416_10927 [Thermoactinomyces sp. DSM 45892]
MIIQPRKWLAKTKKEQMEILYGLAELTRQKNILLVEIQRVA